MASDLQEKPAIAATPSATARQDSAWAVFTSTFVTILLAELGDKTQLTTLLLSAESHAPWVVFAGASSALIATSLLGVVVGRWLSRWLSPRALDLAAGTVMLLISGSLAYDLFTHWS
jgi:putative Ca2+/H+ antiporter (TMEM165/GDT1 family)